MDELQICFIKWDICKFYLKSKLIKLENSLTNCNQSRNALLAKLSWWYQIHLLTLKGLFMRYLDKTLSYEKNENRILVPFSLNPRCRFHTIIRRGKVCAYSHTKAHAPSGCVALHTSHWAPNPKLLQLRPSLLPASLSHIILPVCPPPSRLPSLSGIS